MKKVTALLLSLMMLMMTCAAFAESVAVVYPSSVDDKGWCQAMDSGIRTAIDNGLEIDYTPVENVDTANAANILQQLAGEYDLVIIHGAQFSAALSEVAEEYPEQVFAVGTSDAIFGDNVFSYMPQSEEPGYVNGIIAGLITKVNKVGIVGSTDGGDSARYVRGFVMGLKASNPDCEYMLSWTNSFGDTAGAGDIAQTQIKAGCDVLVGPAQQAIGAIRAVAASENVTFVGQTISQLEDFPEVVVAAADYAYGAVVSAILEQVAGGVTGGICIPMNYNNGGFVYAFSENADLLPADVQAAAQEALSALEATPDTLAGYVDVELN
ncbi:MAG: BMP family protein [Clostridia bacterium]|nr:BMP family protein [Clostridia bacterium]